MSALVLSPGQAPPSPPFAGQPGLVGGNALTLQIASGANVCDLELYSYTSAVQVSDPVAFAKLAQAPAVGWSPPRRVRVSADAPTSIGGSGGAGNVFPDGSAFVAKLPRLVPGPPA